MFVDLIVNDGSLINSDLLGINSNQMLTSCRYIELKILSSLNCIKKQMQKEKNLVQSFNIKIMIITMIIKPDENTDVFSFR